MGIDVVFLLDNDIIWKGVLMIKCDRAFVG